eukprot:4805005-Prymnesium_polylepis.1
MTAPGQANAKSCPQPKAPTPQMSPRGSGAGAACSTSGCSSRCTRLQRPTGRQSWKMQRR